MIVYGNCYENGYLGCVFFEVGWKFDFILIYEFVYEWWGNSVMMIDKVDLWIYESFGVYVELLYVEDWFGYEEVLNYINGKKFNVNNWVLIIGKYEMN